MLRIAFYLAAAQVPGAPETEPEHRFAMNDLLIVASAAIAVGLILLVWMIWFRKKPDDRDHDFPEASPVKSRPDHGESESGEKGRRVKKRRRLRRRDHRPRNATLDKTGGLPPPRPEDQAPPY